MSYSYLEIALLQSEFDLRLCLSELVNFLYNCINVCNNNNNPMVELNIICGNMVNYK